MSPLRILSLARRIITQCLRDRRTFGLIIIVPSVVMALLGYFYTTGSSSTVTLGVVNEDAGLGSLSLSRDVVDALRGQDNLTVIEVSRADVNQSLKDKKLDGAIIFGPGFTKDVILNGTVSAEVITEGTDQGKSVAVNVKVRNAMTSAFAKMKNGSLNLNVSSSVIYGEGFTMLDLFAPYLLGVIAFAFIFIFTGVTFLRERSFGTFERLLVSPITRSEIILGYMLGFSLFAIIQSMIILLFAVFVLNVKIVGSIYSVVALQLLITLVSVNLGIFCSSFAKNELQAVQFIPLLILPQVFLDGMFWPISTLPGYLQVFSYIMPLTYANDALVNIMVRGYGIWDVWADVAILLAFAVAMIALSAMSLNKRLQ